MDNNKVNVKIYGQEYIISGEKSREEIIKIADHVDMKMFEIAEAIKAGGATPTNVATLAAVNIAGEYFAAIDEVEDVRRMNLQLEKDAQHYVQLWDESKKNFTDYKEETQAVAAQKNDLMNEIARKDEEIRQLKKKSEAAAAEMQSGMSEAVAVAEARCRELENSFFDLQMENLQMKKELERYRNAEQIGLEQVEYEPQQF